MAATLTLMAKALGLDKSFSDVSSLKIACIASIDNNKSQLDGVPGYSDYLKWLVNNAQGNAIYTPVSQYNSMTDFVKTLKKNKVITADGGNQKGNSWNEISKYAGEWLAPIYIVERGWINVAGDKTKSIFSDKTKITVPSDSTQSGYDFMLGETPVTVKMPGNIKTNTLKPGDIAGKKMDDDWSRWIDDGRRTAKMKFYLTLFEYLDKASAASGAWRLIYGMNGTGKDALLPELKGDNIEQMALNPANFKYNGSNMSRGTAVSEQAANIPGALGGSTAYWKRMEKDIEDWSKSNGAKESLLEFTNHYYQKLGLFGFTFKTDESTGRGDPNFTNVVKSAEIAGKGRTSTGGSPGFSAEKMGIRMSF